MKKIIAVSLIFGVILMLSVGVMARVPRDIRDIFKDRIVPTDFVFRDRGLIPNTEYTLVTEDYECIASGTSDRRGRISLKVDISYRGTLLWLELSEDVNCGGIPTPVLEWRNMAGEITSSANAGDTVQMVMTNTLSGSFEIWEDDDGFIGFVPGADDWIRVGDDAVLGVADGNDVVGLWTITEEDLTKTWDRDDFYFIVNGEISGRLSIN